METRRIGRTGIEVPVLGLGGIALAQLSVEKGAEVVAAAFDQGIKFIDTARGYDTEATFGEVLKNAMRVINRCWHQRVSFAAGIAEHDALVTRTFVLVTRRIDTLRDIRGLLMYVTP